MPDPLLVRPLQAAVMLGMSRSSLYEHVLPEVRCVRRGRLVLIPRTEIDRWTRENLARLGG